MCHCGSDQREVICGSEATRTLNYSCTKVCDKPLACGNHNCPLQCHSGDCPPCKTSPEVVKTCSCGKVSLDNMNGVLPRVSCMDAIPSCGQICGKSLSCGTSGK